MNEAFLLTRLSHSEELLGVKARVQLNSKPVQKIRLVRNWAVPGTEDRAVAVAVILSQVIPLVL